MNEAGYHILRVGLAITFLWIGVLILEDPSGWADMIPSWAQDLMFMSAKNAMIATAVLDIAVGILLLVNFLPWVGGVVGAAHLAIVLVVVGISAITVRDIGLMAGCIAVAVHTWPKGYLPFRSK